MISQRAQNIVASVTGELSAKVTELKAQGKDVIKLNIGEPDFRPPENIAEAAVAAIEEGFSKYVAIPGIIELRKAICTKLEKDNHLVYSPNEICVSTGAKQAVMNALMALCDPGDEVIIPTPAFSLYDSIVTAAGAKSVFLDVSKTGFQITKEALDACLTERTRAIVLNSPNNPTGVVLKESSLEAVAEAVRQRDIYLICDNVYGALSYVNCPDLTLEEDLRDKTILCQSFSKPYAMTGWRVGYLAAPEGLISRLLLLSAAQIAAVPTFLQTAAETALTLDVTPMRELYRGRRDYVTGRLRDMGLSFPEPEGAFYVFPSIEKFGIPSWEFCTRMIREAGLAAVPGVCFGTEGYIRLSYCYADQELKEGLDRLEGFVKRV